MLTKNFFTAGKAIFTVEPSEAFVTAKAQLGETFHPHYTYRVDRVEMEAKGQWPAKTCYFVKALSGPDNTSDYVYLGMLDAETGEVRLTQKSAFPATATRVLVVQRVLKAIFDGRGGQIAAAGWKVRHNGHCARCARVLTVPESIESGFGPECAKLVA
jgi:hypothetical protein